MTNGLPTTNMAARSAATARPAPLTLLAITLMLMAVAAALFILHVHPAYAQEGSAPDKPRGLEATATPASVTLTWDDPEDESITGYRILRRVRVKNTGGDFSVSGGEHGQRRHHLHRRQRGGRSTTLHLPHQGHQRGMERVNAHGWYAHRHPGRTGAGNRPGGPGPLQPRRVTDGRAGDPHVGPLPPTDAGPVTGYEILRGEGTDEPGTLAADTGSTATTYTDATATTASKSYAYSVKAIRDGERSQASNEAVVQLPPAAPAGVNGAAAHDWILLSWNDPQDDAITGYRILRADVVDGAQGEFAAIAEDTGSTETGYTDTTVEPEQSYVYRVHAIGPGGLSGPSPDLAANTPPAPVSHSSCAGGTAGPLRPVRTSWLTGRSS